jgi:hypothetical protein
MCMNTSISSVLVRVTSISSVAKTNKKLVTTVTHLIYELTIFKQLLKKVNIIPPIILALLINIVMNTFAPVVPPGMKDKK